MLFVEGEEIDACAEIRSTRGSKISKKTFNLYYLYFILSCTPKIMNPPYEFYFRSFDSKK
jgi:hypothetical protein